MEGSTMQKEIITPEILAGKLGRTTDAIRKRWNGIWPGRKFSASAELTETEVQQLSASGSAGNSVSVTKRKGAEKKSKEIPQETRTETVPETITETITEKENKSESVDSLQMQAGQKVASSASVRMLLRLYAFFKANLVASAKAESKTAPSNPFWSLAGLYLLLISATSASVYNLFQVTLELTDYLSAVTLTAVISASAVIFISVGVKSPLTGFVVCLLIAYEGICNTVRIYGGLTHWGEGTPNVFLRTVTDVFSTGTYATATLIGAVTAALIAGVQYASVFEINRLKNGKV